MSGSPQNKERSSMVSIMSYFPVRKRTCTSEVSSEISEKRRRGTVIAKAEFLSPAEVRSGMTPIHVRCLDVQDERKDGLQRAAAALHPPTPLGFFGELSPSLYHYMFHGIDVSCLVSLCMTSSAVSTHLLNYVQSNIYIQRLHNEGNDFTTKEGLSRKLLFTRYDPFYCHGKLLKAVSICFPTSKRVTLLKRFCERAISHGINLHGLGRIIHTMCHKWAFSECAKVLHAILELNDCRLKKALKQISEGEPGSLPKVEMEVREFIRSLLLTGRDARYEGADVEWIFWISAVIRTFTEPMSQSRLLMVLFGPTVELNGEVAVDWRLFCEHVVTSLELAETIVKPLSDVLHLLLKTNRLERTEYVWTQHDVFNVIEELSTSPEPWSFDNFVSLLLQRPALIPVSLVARMNHEYTEEACLLFISFMTMAHCWNMNVYEVLHQPIIQAVRSLSRERAREFFEKVCDLYANQLKDFSSRGRDGARDLRSLLDAYGEIAPILQEISTLLW